MEDPESPEVQQSTYATHPVPAVQVAYAGNDKSRNRLQMSLQLYLHAAAGTRRNRTYTDRHILLWESKRSSLGQDHIRKRASQADKTDTRAKAHRTLSLGGQK